MNFSLFLLTATTKWSLRLVYVVELLQLLLVEAQALIPMLQGDDGGSDSSSNALECVVRLPPSFPHQLKLQQKEELAVYLYYIYTSRACNNFPHIILQQ